MVPGLDYYHAAPLNKAHLLERKAERCLQNDKYEDAIEYHLQAAQILRDFLVQVQPIILPENAISSLELQIKYHEKQEKIIPLRKKQNETRKEIQLKNERLLMRTSQEAFQNVSAYSTTSIDSCDSTDYGSTSFYNNTNGSSHELNKRDDVIKKMGLFIRLQQNEILALSNKLKEKDSDMKHLRERITHLEEQSRQPNIDAENDPPKHN